MAVCDMVDHNHAVLFDSGGSYAIHKKTGRKTTFTRNGRGWDLKEGSAGPTAPLDVVRRGGTFLP